MGIYMHLLYTIAMLNKQKSEGKSHTDPHIFVG